MYNITILTNILIQNISVIIILFTYKLPNEIYVKSSYLSTIVLTLFIISLLSLPSMISITYDIQFQNYKFIIPTF